MATLKDVARRAGVSVSTVSHVINGYDDINPKTHEQVMQAVRELNYHPSAVARNLQRKRSAMIGVVTIGRDAVMHPFFSQIICALAEGVQLSGFGINLTVVDPDKLDVERHTRTWREQRFEGLIVMGFAEDNPIVESVADLEVPAVFLDTVKTAENKMAISSDNVQGAYSIVKHLIELGHERIALIHGAPRGKIIEDRWKGYRLALKEHGIEEDEDLFECADFTKAGAYQACNRLLSRARPTAVFCVSDMMALGAIACATDRGLRVPEDLAVVGFDDIPVAEHVTPALTTVRQQGYNMGYVAITRLMEGIRNKKLSAVHEQLATELVVRRSCGAARP